MAAHAMAMKSAAPPTIHGVASSALNITPVVVTLSRYLLLPHNFHRFEGVKLRRSGSPSNRWRRRWVKRESEHRDAV